MSYVLSYLYPMGGSLMIRRLLFSFLGSWIAFSTATAVAQNPSFHALAFYSRNVEPDHLAFAEQALQFFADTAKRDGIDFESTTRWDDLDASTLKQYQVIVWLNDFPHT